MFLLKNIKRRYLPDYDERFLTISHFERVEGFFSKQTTVERIEGLLLRYFLKSRFMRNSIKMSIESNYLLPSISTLPSHNLFNGFADTKLLDGKTHPHTLFSLALNLCQYHITNFENYIAADFARISISNLRRAYDYDEDVLTFKDDLEYNPILIGLAFMKKPNYDQKYSFYLTPCRASNLVSAQAKSHPVRLRIFLKQYYHILGSFSYLND